MERDSATTILNSATINSRTLYLFHQATMTSPIGHNQNKQDQDVDKSWCTEQHVDPRLPPGPDLVSIHEGVMFSKEYKKYREKVREIKKSKERKKKE